MAELTPSSALQQVEPRLVHLKKLFEADVAKLNPKEQETWLSEVGSQLAFWGSTVEFTMLVEAEILAGVKEQWDKVDASIKSTWGGDFRDWARAYTKRGIKLPAGSTVDNKIRVYRSWLGTDHVDMPEWVEISALDNLGNPIKDEEPVEVLFEPKEIEYAKLLTATGPARRGELTPPLWGALMDPSVGDFRFKQLLAEEQTKDDPKIDVTKEFYLFRDGSVVYAKDGAVIYAVAMIEGVEGEQASKGVNRFLAALGLPVVDAITPTNGMSELIAKNNGEFLISKEGTVVGLFSEDEALSIAYYIAENSSMEEE